MPGAEPGWASATPVVADPHAAWWTGLVRPPFTLAAPAGDPHLRADGSVEVADLSGDDRRRHQLGAAHPS
jgi:hypothetical protein